ncbi:MULTISPECIES: hypothetical protein [unclassified Sphingomonas]|uniref:hypothetical protein n=1 Tax=unclassified Sphingomonas TaxID=196159 RepID=UPI00226A72A9|nr:MULTISPECIES: hypothetical protein [unclassified Sphingomonas]
MKIGFLFNHDALHQVRHTAPVIAELARNPAASVSVLTSSPAQEAEVRALLGEQAAVVRFVALTIGPVARTIDAGLHWIAPFRRVAMLRENFAIFAALDVLVVPETTSLMLRDRFGLRDLNYVWIPHGAGDRSVGFRAVARGFDLVLLSGEKVRDRMLAAGVITADNHAIVGYPKFDTVAFASPPPRLFANDRPTVLYNPHFDPALSSWYDWAQPIIDWFAGQNRFNLVVAPHVMLFQRRWHASVEHRRVRRRRDLPTLATDHIIIDPGSSRSVDMSYTRAADIYLGDASSQIYEWIVRPRPAIFLNPSHVAWLGDANFAHWRLGEVIDRLDQLPAALARAVDHPDAFRAPQEAALASTFSVTDEPAARRAARAIMERFG